MHYRFYFVALAACLAFFFAVEAHSSFFVTSGEGTRPVAMGGAFTAVADDANALWYNPAGLGRLQAGELALGYVRLFPGISGDQLHRSQLNVAMPIGRGMGVGLGVSYLNADVISETAVVFGYALSIGDQITAGAAAKLLGWQADGSVDPVQGTKDDDFSKWTPSLDVGVVLHPGGWLGADRLDFGFVIRDPISPNISESGSDDGKLPVEARIGLLYQRAGVLLALDTGRREGLQMLNLGVEYQFPEAGLVLRAGGLTPLGDLSPGEGGGVGMGFGYHIMGFQFDYSYSYPLAFSLRDGTHLFSIGYRF